MTAQSCRPRTTAAAQAIIRKRDLQGQSPFVVNASLEYAQRDGRHVPPPLQHGRATPSQRVQDRTALPDFIQKRRDSLDFVYLKKVVLWGVPLTVKLSVENILNDNYLTTVGDETQEDYRTGVTAALGISYAY